MTDKQVKVMEDILKEAICTILSLPKQTNYEALLYEVGNFHIQQWMELMKLKFYNKKMHIKKKGRLYRVIRSELIEGYEHHAPLCQAIIHHQGGQRTLHGEDR